MKWYIKTDYGWKIEDRTQKPRNIECYPIDYDYPWPEVYELHTDGDGTVTVMLSENKLANKVDQLRAQAYKDGIWDLIIDLNL